MGQTAIGRAALVLTTDASQARAGLSKFGDDVKQDAGKIAASVGGGSGGGLLGRLVAGAPGAIAGVVGAAVGLVSGFVHEQTAKLKDLAKVGRQADALGIDSAQFQGLSSALKRVGVEGDGVVNVFGRLAHTTATAAEGNGAAAAAFARIGIDAGELARLPLDQQFLRISSAMKALPPGANQAATAIDIFGKRGATLLPVLTQGGDALQKWIDKEKQLGNAVGAEDMKAVQSAAAAIPKLHKAWDGLYTRITVAVAPALEKVFGLMTDGVGVVTPLFVTAGKVLGTLGEIEAEVAAEVAGAVRYVVGSVGDWIKETVGLGETTLTVRGVVLECFRGIGTSAALAWDVIRAGAGIAATAFGYVVESGLSVVSVFRTVVDLGRQLPDSLKPAGFDGFADAVGRADDRVKAVGREIKEWGIGAVTSFGSTAVQFNAWLDRIAAKQKKQTEEQKRDAIGAAAEVAALTKFDNGALARGSSAEVTARLRYEAGGKVDAQLAEAKKGNELLKGIKEEVGGQADQVGKAVGEATKQFFEQMGFAGAI